MLHRTLCDQIPTNPKYIIWATPGMGHISRWPWKALDEWNEAIVARYNKTAKPLPELSIGTQVSIHQPQNKSTPRQIETGEIVSKLPNRQYKVKCHATWRKNLRNRRFIKPLHQSATPHPVISSKIIPQQANENQSITNHH